jgi:hypothetical protein
MLNSEPNPDDLVLRATLSEGFGIGLGKELVVKRAHDSLGVGLIYHKRQVYFRSAFGYSCRTNVCSPLTVGKQSAQNEPNDQRLPNS